MLTIKITEEQYSQFTPFKLGGYRVDNFEFVNQETVQISNRYSQFRQIVKDTNTGKLYEVNLVVSIDPYVTIEHDDDSLLTLAEVEEVEVTKKEYRVKGE